MIDTHELRLLIEDTEEIQCYIQNIQRRLQTAFEARNLEAVRAILVATSVADESINYLAFPKE